MGRPEITLLRVNQAGELDVTGSERGDAIDSGADSSHVRIVLQHPDYDMSAVTRELRMEPSRCWGARDLVSTPSGRLVGGTYGYSMWTWSCAERDGPRIGRRVESVVQNLERASGTVRQIVETGGTASIFVDLSGEANIGVLVDSSLMRRMASLGLCFGYEVFPK